MSFKQTPLRPIQVVWMCDKCEVGEYRPHGKNTYLTDPMQFPHKCNKCGHEAIAHEKFPALRWAKEGELLDLNEFNT